MSESLSALGLLFLGGSPLRKHRVMPLPGAAEEQHLVTDDAGELLIDTAFERIMRTVEVPREER